MTSDQGQLSEIQLAVTAAAIEGDAAAVYHVASDLLGQGMPMDAILFDVLAPVQASMGHRWMSGDYLISEEHAATAAIETVVAMLAGSLERPTDGPRVVIGAVEGDAHSLPGRMVAADLLYRGFRTTLLGASMPAEDLGEYLSEEQPNFLVLTCAMTMHLAGAAASIAAGHSAGIPVLVGGGAFGPAGERARRLGADGWVPGLRDVAAKLDAWIAATDRAPAESARDAAAASEIEDLAGSRPLFVTGAASALAVQEGSGGVRHYDELGMLFDVLVAAMAVDDDEVLLEFTDWLAALLDARGEDAGTVAEILAAMRAVIEPASVQADQLLATAAQRYGVE